MRPKDPREMLPPLQDGQRLEPNQGGALKSLPIEIPLRQREIVSETIDRLTIEEGLQRASFGNRARSGRKPKACRIKNVFCTTFGPEPWASSPHSFRMELFRLSTLNSHLSTPSRTSSKSLETI